MRFLEVQRSVLLERLTVFHALGFEDMKSIERDALSAARVIVRNYLSGTSAW